jgi:D-alanyl-D-alanine carboxypeptidase/D-alanyl-D-alanine-endopeptidase (penicillin-binding protein 4)
MMPRPRNWTCRRSRIQTAALLLIISLVALPLAAFADLRDDVNSLLSASGIKRTNVAISIADASSQATLVSINANQPMIPASNMKLLTSGAALHYLGPRFEFTTRIIRNGDKLVVLGDGDPAFGDPELLEIMTVAGYQGLDVDMFLDLWIKPIVASGMKRVSELVVDDRIFDREFVHPTWPLDQLNRTYCAEVAGLTFHANILRFYPRPDSDGRPILSTFEPHMPWIFLTNRGTCKSGAHDTNDGWIARQIGTNQLTFYGNVRTAYRSPYNVPVTVHDMPSQFAHLLVDRLKSAGVTVGSFRVATADEPAFEGDTIAPVISTPISTVVTRCNRDSANLYAECLIKRIGYAMTRQPGSWLNGAAIVRHAVHERLEGSAMVNGLIVADGSGMSRDNKVTAELITAWLNTFHKDDRVGSIFIESLANPGDQGTLEKRFRSADLKGATVQAKSGYINHVSCLSGYVTGADGRRYSFSVLGNDLKNPGEIAMAKKLQEKVVVAIANELAAVRVSIGSD